MATLCTTGALIAGPSPPQAFTNEPYELQRYSDAIAKYQAATRTSQSSMSLLNLSQGERVCVMDSRSCAAEPKSV